MVLERTSVKLILRSLEIRFGEKAVRSDDNTTVVVSSTVMYVCVRVKVVRDMSVLSYLN